MFFCSRCCLGLLAATCRLGRFETLRDFPRNAVAHASSSTCGRSDRSSFSSVLCYYDHRLLPLGWKSRAIPQKHRSRNFSETATYLSPIFLFLQFLHSRVLPVRIIRSNLYDFSCRVFLLAELLSYLRISISFDTFPSLGSSRV